MRKALSLLFVLAAVAAWAPVAAAGEVVELKTDHVRDVKGDGPDGKGNTADDTWQFWFELVAPKAKFLHLDVATSKMSEQQRKNGVRRKITGPVGKYLPNPDASEGWIYHSDWDGRMEGAWGDEKTGKVILHPYVEKGAHRAVALTYKVPKSGTYKVTGGVTDGQVWKHKLHKGFVCKVGTGSPAGKFMKVDKVLTKTEVIGDEVGPVSGTFAVESAGLEQGVFLVVLVDPNGWWGSDVMVIDSLKIEFLGEAEPRAAAGNRLTPQIAADPKGDGPDGKGNTGDDTWQFWFQIIHDRNEYRLLDIATAAMPAEQKQKGIPRKVWGPVGSQTPNPEATEGWIYHSDWDGKSEGVWGDAKAGQVIVTPYQEKADGGSLAVTYKVPADGTYIVSGRATDMKVDKDGKTATGVKVSVDVTKARDGKGIGKAERILVEPKAVGDAAGPKSLEFSSGKVALRKGELVRLVIDPNKWATGDMTRIDAFKIEPAE